MSYQIDETHDPNLQSWVEAANDPQTDFPIQNLPFGLFALGEDEPVSYTHLTLPTILRV